MPMRRIIIFMREMRLDDDQSCGDRRVGDVAGQRTSLGGRLQLIRTYCRSMNRSQPWIMACVAVCKS